MNPDQNSARAKNKISTFSVVAMIYSIIASGAFGIEEMIPECGPGMSLILLAVLALVFALPFGLLCAEAGSARPGEGGSLIWVKEALGEFWFGIMVIIQAIWSLLCNTIYIVLSVDYLGHLFPMDEKAQLLVKIGFVLIFFTVNILGIKESSRVSTALFISIIVVFLFATVIGFINFRYNPFVPMFSGEYDNAFQHIGSGFAIAMWMYAGFDELSVLSGEIKDSNKIIPRAIMITVPLLALSNILPTMAGLSSVGQWQNWTTDINGVGYISILKNFVGPAAAAVFILIAVFCKLSTFNVILATGSRCIMVLSEEHFGPAFLSEKQTKKNVPYISLIIVSIFTLLLIPFSFRALVVLDVFFTIMVTGLTLAAIWVLRRRLDKSEYGFRIAGGDTVHSMLCFMVFAVCLFGVLVNGCEWYLGGLLWTCSIPIIYCISKILFKGCSKNDAESYPINPKTRLGFGDLKRIGFFYAVLGAFAVCSRYFIQWYEGSWAEEYYLETYKTGLFSDFGRMLSAISLTGYICIAAGAVLLAVTFTNRKSNL